MDGVSCYGSQVIAVVQACPAAPLMSYEVILALESPPPGWIYPSHRRFAQAPSAVGRHGLPRRFGRVQVERCVLVEAEI